MNEIEFSAGPPTSVEQAGRSRVDGGGRPALEASPMYPPRSAGSLAYAPIIHTMNLPRKCRECKLPFVTVNRTQRECSPICARKRKLRYLAQFRARAKQQA